MAPSSTNMLAISHNSKSFGERWSLRSWVLNLSVNLNHTTTTDHPMYNLSTSTHRMVPETGRVSLLCLWPLRTAAGRSGWLPDYSKENYSQRHPDHLHLLLWCEPVRQRQNMRENLNNGVPDISWRMCAWAAVTWFFSTIKDCFRAPVVVWPLL